MSFRRRRSTRLVPLRGPPVRIAFPRPPGYDAGRIVGGHAGRQQVIRHTPGTIAMGTDGQEHGFATRAIHAGQDAAPATGATVVPIYATSTYTQAAPGQHKGF